MVPSVASPGGAGEAVRLARRSLPRIGPEQVTLLRYKLDPGELGILRSATPGKSQLAVAAQELGNLREFERRAAMRGEVVVQKKISFKRSLVDGRTAVVAGRTEVYSRPPREAISPQKTPVEGPPAGAERPEKTGQAQTEDRSPQGRELTLDEAAVRADVERRLMELSQEKVRLESELRQIETKLTPKEAKRGVEERAALLEGGGALNFEQAQARREKLSLELKRQQLRRELARLEAMRTARQIEQLTRTLTNAILENARVGHKLGRASLVFRSLSAPGGVIA